MQTDKTRLLSSERGSVHGGRYEWYLIIFPSPPFLQVLLQVFRCLVLGVGDMGDQTIDTYLPSSSFMDRDL